MKPAAVSPLVFKVVHWDGAWSVEHEGGHSDSCYDKDEAIASATKQARAAQADGGRPVQVRIEGETGYF